MPNIKTYDAGEVGLRPEERGITAFREAGAEAQRMGVQAERSYSRAAAFEREGFDSIGRAVGQFAQDYENHQDTLAISDMAQKEADFDLQQHQSLDNIMAPRPDPTDPNGQRMITPDPNQAGGLIGDRLTQWKEARSQLREQITNKKALEKFDLETPKAYGRYAEKAYAIEGNLNYQAVGNNLIQSTQKNAGVVYADPNQLDAQLAKLHDNVQTMTNSTNMTAPNRMKFQTEFEQKSARALIESAVEGSARLGPAGRQHALDLISSGKYDQWIGTDHDKLITHINSMDRADRADQEAQRRQQAEQEKDKALQRTDEYVQDMASPQPKMKVTDILQDPNYKNRPDLRSQAVGVVEKMRKLQAGDADVPANISHDHMMTLFNGINKQFGEEGRLADRSEIDKAFGVDHTINEKDYKFLIGQLGQRDKPLAASLAKSREQFLKDNALTIDPTRIGGNPPSALGNQRINEARQSLIQQEQSLISQNKNPASLYDPHDPNYFGRQLGKFAVSKTDAQKYDIGLKDDLVKTLKQYSPAGGDHAVMEHQPIASQYKNFFSSGRAQGAGIEFNPNVDLSHISVNGKVAQVNRWAAPHFQAFLDDLAAHGYTVRELGGYSDRDKRGGSTKSEHAYGNAIDINEATNGFKGTHTDMPKDIAEIAARHGLIWGGNWHTGSQDPMHFEWSGVNVPEGATRYGSQGGQPFAVAKVPPMQQQYAPVKTMQDVVGLKPGTRFLIPDGPYKGMVGTVPEPKVPMSK